MGSSTPYTAFCCGVTFEEELGCIPRFLDASPSMETHDDCGYYQLLVTHVAEIDRADAGWYDHTYDYGVQDTVRAQTRDDRLLYCSASEPHMMFTTANEWSACGASNDTFCALVRVTFVRVLREGRLASRTLQGSDDN